LAAALSTRCRGLAGLCEKPGLDSVAAAFRRALLDFQLPP
jgi:hypothetical protein